MMLVEADHFVQVGEGREVRYFPQLTNWVRNADTE